MNQILRVVFALSFIASACGNPAVSEDVQDSLSSTDQSGPDALAQDTNSPPLVWDEVTHVGPVPVFEQIEGDPEAGYLALLNKPYVSCGFPKSLQSLIGGDAGSEFLEGRNEKNKAIPYFLTHHETDEGVEILTTNCLTCHASVINGEFVLGLGDVFQDYTNDQTGLLATAENFAALLLKSPEEEAELMKFVKRAKAIAPWTVMRTAGVNPAVSVSAGIMEYLDPVTLIWQDEPVLEVPPEYRELKGGLSVPPWWHMKKKNLPFYTVSGGGSHVAWSMLASSMCVEGPEEAAEIASYFPDILAYIASIEPPEYPFEINTVLAEQGALLFDQSCSQCHGTYGEDWTYPNLVVGLDEVGTDPDYAQYMFDAEIFHQWFEDSWYGQHSWPSPALGYIAPPLDGIWATAPYFHNGAVPTVDLVLNSEERPDCWTWSFNPNDYNKVAVGWIFSESVCHADESDPQKRGKIYDTSHTAYGKDGHPFGDHFSDAERKAVIEYLKTL
jgi:mono/diheme cytochrome c family protein